MSFLILYNYDDAMYRIKIRTIITVLLLFSLGLIATAQDTTYFPTDSWRTASLSDVDMDESHIQTGIDAYITRFPHVNSLLIIKDGYLVLENYYNDTNGNTVNNVYSITKSVTSTLIGMAIEDGIIPNLDITLSEALPQYFADTQFPDKANITLRDILMMRSGIGWIEIFQAIEHIKGEKDETLAMLENPMIARAGAYWNYSTGASHLLSAIFQSYAGIPLEDYAQKRLFEPLGITDWYWREDTQGTNFGGSEFYTTPLNLSRFGYWVLHGGKWDGEQLVSSDWIALTTTSRADNTDDYAYHWWIYNHEGVAIFTAQGFGGQIIMGMPDYDLLVIITTNPDFGAPNRDDNLDLLHTYIVPAINGTGR